MQGSNSFDGFKDAPHTIRGMFATSEIVNTAHGSDSNELAQKELDLFFNKFQQEFDNSFLNEELCCVIIKPHLLIEKKLGESLFALQKKLSDQRNTNICALQQFKLDRKCTEEFLEVYRGVLPNYADLVNELSNKPCLVLAVRGDQNIVNELRMIIGPHDPQIAKTVRNGSLRAQFGKNLVQNGYHVTDLEEDGQLECQYFFEIMQDV